MEVLRHEVRCRIRRHDAVGIACADGTAVAGGGVVREPAGVLNCPVGSCVAITPDLLAYWPRQKLCRVHAVGLDGPSNVYDCITRDL